MVKSESSAQLKKHTIWLSLNIASCKVRAEWSSSNFAPTNSIYSMIASLDCCRNFRYLSWISLYLSLSLVTDWKHIYGWPSTSNYLFGRYLSPQIPVRLIACQLPLFCRVMSCWGTGAIVTGCSSCRHQWLLSDSNPGPIRVTSPVLSPLSHGCSNSLNHG